MASNGSLADKLPPELARRLAEVSIELRLTDKQKHRIADVIAPFAWPAEAHPIWACPACGLYNFRTSHQCAECETAAPHAHRGITPDVKRLKEA